MKWLEAKSGNRGGRTMPAPSVPAVSVRVYKEKKSRDTERMALFLSAAFIKAARLRPGDRLAIGYDAAKDNIGLMRSVDGNSISGNGWSLTREGRPTKGKNTTPYVSFGLAAYPELEKWARSRVKTWVRMIERDGFFVSSDALDVNSK